MSDLNMAENPVLVFDWGGTLMQVFPEYSGPMANWPRVAEVEGAGETLKTLYGKYTMVVATNAADSDAGQVWEALKRAGLSDYFRAVFTSKELGGSKKPSRRFFLQLESVLARPAHQLIMIGDDFAVDMLGAKAAGWRSIWLNPDGEMASALLPLHDAEIRHLRDLPAALQQPCPPDYATCLAWMQERGTPYNILAHVNLVAATAYLLAVWLRVRGVPVDPVLTHRGGILHDLAKMDSIHRAREHGDLGDHAAMARDFLLARGQPELAEIANRHMPYQDPLDPRRPETWEQKLVHYADKLAEGNRLVALEERIQALKGRYPQSAQELERSWPILQSIEEEISSRLGIDPQGMLEKIRSVLRT